MSAFVLHRLSGSMRIPLIGANALSPIYPAFELNDNVTIRLRMKICLNSDSMAHWASS